MKILNSINWYKNHERGIPSIFKKPKNKMKKNLLVLILLMFLPLMVSAQVDITATQGTGYYLETATGDTLQLRGSTPFYSTYRVALKDAVNYSAEQNIVVHVRSNMNERVEADPYYFTYFDEIFIEVPSDTVYTTLTDTVYVETTVTDSIFVETMVTDTVFVEMPADTIFTEVETVITETVVDTFYVDRIETVVDTLYVTEYETITETVVDTVTVTEYVDRIETVTDTVFVDVIETVTDTIYVDRVETVTDTVTVTEQVPYYITEYDTLYVASDPTNFADSTFQYAQVQSSLEGIRGTDSTKVVISGIANQNRFKQSSITYVCRDSLSTFITQPISMYGSVIYGEFMTTCQNELTVGIDLVGPQDTVYVEDNWPAFSFADGEFTPSGYLTHFDQDTTTLSDSTWVNTWGTLDYKIEDSFLILDLLQRSIARLEWTTVPDHRNIRVTVNETIHASHSTGIHMSMRTSPEDRQHSVETYINLNGIGVSIFSGGAWSNPIDFPFNWEYGVPIIYVVELIDDTIRVKAWNEGEPEPTMWNEYTSDVIGNIPNGTFSVGSTGAGLYLLDRIEIDLLD